jgi:hypothetical protein
MRRAGGGGELPLYVELDPVGVGIGDIVAEIPGEFSDDGRVDAEGVAMKVAELGGEAPAARGVQVVGLMELGEDGVAGVAAAA